ncbi:MAG: alpha/beta fold hydrolase [Thermoleophilia bacterium]|nr:alpha/beta fold hydrolase [Thermoleophilia bacterium]
MNKKPIYKTPAGERQIMAYYDQILAQWPASTESLYLETRRGRTHVLVQGQKGAPSLVLLHGAGANALAWGADIPELSRHFRVYAVETPGEPGRSCQERFSWRGDAVVEWLEDVVDALGAAAAAEAAASGAACAAAPVLLAGISQGGYSALRFASAHPERVKALVLLAPGGVTQTKPSFILRGLTYGVLGRGGRQALMRCIMGDCDGGPEAADFMDLIFTHFRSRTDAPPLLTDEQLRRLTMPVLLMAGASDNLFDSPKTIARLERLVEGADARLLPGASHALINVAPMVTPFLAAAAADLTTA